MKFAGQVVWITGASSGIGEASAFAFAREGARLVLSSRRPAELERVRRACARPDEHVVLPLDLTQSNTFPAAVSEVIARGGTLSYQALATGSTPPAGRPAPDAEVNITRALQFAPKLLLLSFPTNDTAAGYSADETAANLLALQRAAQAAGAAALVLGVQPRDGLNSGQRTVLADVDQRLAAQAGSCFVALFAALADGNGNIAAAYAAGDGIHLNDAGHRVVRERVQAVLDGGRCVRLAAAG